MIGNQPQTDPLAGALANVGPTDSSNSTDPSLQQDVAAALNGVNMPIGDAPQDEPLDDVASGMMSGGIITVRDQAHYDSLSEPQKAVIRAMQATGGKMRSSDAVRIYQDTVRQSRATQPINVALPDGRTVTMLNNQIVPEPKRSEPTKMEIKESDTGTYIAIDPTSGRAFPVWNQDTGEPIRAKPKMSESQRQEATLAQSTIDRTNAQLSQLMQFPDDANVSLQKNDGFEEYKPASWFGTPVAKVKEKLLADMKAAEGRRDRALNPPTPGDARPAAMASPTPRPAVTPSPTPSPTPNPTPTPNPMPTPDKFVVGKRYRDGNGAVRTYAGNGVWQ